MGSTLSMDRSLVVSQPPRSLVRLQQHVYTLVRLWLRFWIAATGLERQEKLVRRLVQHIQRRTYRTASTKYECTHHVVVTLLELWLQTLRALLAPDVFTRFLCATFVLHIVHQLQAVARQVVGNAVRRFSAKGRRSLRLQQQLEHAQSFAERQSIAGELDKVEGRDKWRADPKSNLFLYERVTNKTLMYKTLEREKDVVRLMFALRAGLLRKHWGLGNPRLYSVSNGLSLLSFFTRFSLLLIG